VVDLGPCPDQEFVSFSVRKPATVFRNSPSVFPLAVPRLAGARERPHRARVVAVRMKGAVCGIRRSTWFCNQGRSLGGQLGITYTGNHTVINELLRLERRCMASISSARLGTAMTLSRMVFGDRNLGFPTSDVGRQTACCPGRVPLRDSEFHSETGGK